MASTDLSGKLFQKYLMEMISEIVWKDSYTASIAEQECDQIYTDRYTSAARSLLEHYSISELIAIANYSAERFSAFLNTAPTQLTDKLTLFWQYEEPNTYYRMLYGKPPKDCDPKYWVLPQIDNQWGLSPNEPIHDVSINILTIIENDGGLDKYKELIEVDKTFKYVEHMTSKKIYPFVARLADRFDLLYVPTTDIATLTISFKETYDLCRDFIIQRYYSDAYRQKYENYEGMIGMCILFQTVEHMHVNYLDADITRDFYDLDSIKIIYDAYSVPFYDIIPTVYHQKIVKLINRLLMHKGSNQVFYDLCSLFDYNALEIYKYYLVREQRMDADGNPVFVYAADGNLDYQQSYKVSFAQGTLDGDPFVDVVDSNNKLEYYPITTADPFWVDDSELMQKIYQTEYNFIETKYIGLQMVFSLTAYLYETCYFIKMLLDNRNAISYITVSHGKLGSDIDLFTLVIYIHALISAKFGYAGNIPADLSSISKVMGFNFKDDLNLIISDIQKDQYIDIEDMPKIINILQHMQITNIKTCASTYDSIESLAKLIDARLLRCKDPNVYFSYKRLYKVLLTSKYMEDVFMKSDNTQATTYLDLLSDINAPLALRLEALSHAEIIQELQYSLIALQKAASDLKYIQNYGGTNNEVVIDYLYKLIRFFKSAKVDLVDFKTIYIVDGRSTNMIKLMTRLLRSTIDTDLPGSVLDITDTIHFKRTITEIGSVLNLTDKAVIQLLYRWLGDDNVGLDARIKSRTIDYDYPIDNVLVDLTDTIHRAIYNYSVKDRSLILKDKLIKLN